MSVASSTAVLANLETIQQVALIPNNRTLGTLVADAVLEEEHDDTWTITGHPVEVGTSVNDHIFKNPATVRLRYVWTPGGSQNTLKDPNFLRSIYQQVLALGVNKTPFQIQTGKRYYLNMAVERIHLETDKWSENIVEVVVDCQELILVSTQTVTITPEAAQVLPQKTNPPTPQGSLSLSPGSNFNPSFAPPITPP